jgi:hypothetical protein
MFSISPDLLLLDAGHSWFCYCRAGPSPSTSARRTSLVLLLPRWHPFTKPLNPKT